MNVDNSKLTVSIEQRLLMFVYYDFLSRPFLAKALLFQVVVFDTSRLTVSIEQCLLMFVSYVPGNISLGNSGIAEAAGGLIS